MAYPLLTQHLLYFTQVIYNDMGGSYQNVLGNLLMILFANVFNLSETSPRADRTKLPIKVEEVEKKKKE